MSKQNSRADQEAGCLRKISCFRDLDRWNGACAPPLRAEGRTKHWARQEKHTKKQLRTEAGGLREAKTTKQSAKQFKLNGAEITVYVEKSLRACSLMLLYVCGWMYASLVSFLLLLWQTEPSLQALSLTVVSVKICSRQRLIRAEPRKCSGVNVCLAASSEAIIALSSVLWRKGKKGNPPFFFQI